MKFFNEPNSFLKFFLAFIVLIIPVLALAIDARLSGYRVPANRTITGVVYTNSSGGESFPLLAIENTSANEYFVPTKTFTEWQSFAAGKPAALTIKDYCGGGACETATENCANCESDCSSCPTCTSFTYSDWTDCIDGYKTRVVLTSSPDGCTGGSPVTSSTEGCTSGTASGCAEGYTCSSEILYYAASDCSGYYSRTAAKCITDAEPRNTCISHPPTSHVNSYPSATCSYTYTTPPPEPGCNTGYKCVRKTTYYSSLDCVGYNSVDDAVCVPDSTPTGCSNYTYASIYYYPTTGCTY